MRWRGPGTGDKVHGGLGREMERVVRSREGRREPRRGGKGQGRLKRAWGLERFRNCYREPWSMKKPGRI